MKALNRLIYTITNQNKPNQADVDALNDVIRYYNKERERLIVNNKLYAKLFLNAFKGDIIKSNGNYQLSIDNLRSIAKISLNDQLDSLVRESNAIFLQNEIETYKGDISKFEYPKYDVEKMKQRIKDIIVNIIEDYNDYE